MNKLSLGALSVLVLLTQGCATLFDGKTSEVTFTSEPSGVLVTVDELSGTTPVTLTIPKKATEATFAFDGEARTVELERSMQGGFILMDILFTPGFGLSGLLIDGATGAWYEHQAVVHCDRDAPAEVPEGAEESGEATASP